MSFGGGSPVTRSLHSSAGTLRKGVPGMSLSLRTKCKRGKPRPHLPISKQSGFLEKGQKEREWRILDACAVGSRENSSTDWAARVTSGFLRSCLGGFSVSPPPAAGLTVLSLMSPPPRPVRTCPSLAQHTVPFELVAPPWARAGGCGPLCPQGRWSEK